MSTVYKQSYGSRWSKQLGLLVSIIFLLLSLSGWFPSGGQRSTMSIYFPGFLGPEREGALHLHSLGRLGGHLWPHVDGASLLSWDFIDFSVYWNQGTSASFLLSSIFLSITFFPSLSKSITNAVSPSGFPGSCGGWTPASKGIFQAKMGALYGHIKDRNSKNLMKQKRLEKEELY